MTFVVIARKTTQPTQSTSTTATLMVAMRRTRGEIFDAGGRGSLPQRGHLVESAGMRLPHFLQAMRGLCGMSSYAHAGHAVISAVIRLPQRGQRSSSLDETTSSVFANSRDQGE